MKTTIIALGTTSKWKINFANKILNEIGIKFTLIPIKAESKVSEQPLTEDETRLGSINRAKHALEETQKADIGLGVEVGYDKDKKGDYEIFCYASIVDKEENIFSSCSQKVLLPKMHQQVLKENKNMQEHVAKYYKKDNHPATQYLAKLIDERETLIIEAVRQSILRYYRKEDF